MAAVVNFIDVTLGGALARTVNLPTARILLTPSAPAFHVDAAGKITPASITFTATVIDLDLDAPLTFNSTGGPLTNVAATTAVLAGADMTGSSATVIASATVNGVLYTGPCTISKFSDGKDGKDADGSNLTPGDLKAILEGQLTTDELNAALRGRIGLIDAGADTAGSVTARVKASTDAALAAIAQEANDRRTYVQDYAYSKQEYNQSLSAFGTSIQAAYQGYADTAAGNALAAARAYAQSYAYSKADADSALTATANTLRSEFATLNQGTGATVAWVQEYAYSKAQANEAIASATQQLSTTVSGHTTTLELQGQSISGLGAQYTVKIDNNGYASGFGLASTPINGVPTSSFIVLADRFAVALPGQAAKYPFAIGRVNGQQTIAFNGNIIADGSFTFRDANGKVLLSVGVPLDQSLAAPGTLNSDLAPAIDAASSKGAALNDDPGILNLDAWNLTSRVERRAGGAFGLWHFACPAGLNEMAIPKRRFTVDPAKTYDLTAMLYAAGGNSRNMYIFVNFINAAGERLAAGWGGTMSGYTHGGLPDIGVWKRYGGMFGAGINGRPIPSGTVEAEIGVWFQYEGGPGSSQVDQAAQDLRCEEVTVAYNAAKAAADARYVADAAISRYEAMSADGILSRSEKIDLIALWQQEDASAVKLIAQANAFGISFKNYQDNRDATWVYLSGLRPNWNDTTQDTNIDRGYHNDRFRLLVESHVALQNEIAMAASKAAPIGSNLISNSDFGAGTTTGWGVGYTEVPPQNFALLLDGAGDDWRAAGTHNIAINRGGNALNGVVDVTCQQNIAVVAGARFEASAYLASHRCASSLNIRFFRREGANEIDVGGEVAIAPPFRSGGGQDLKNWARAQGFFNAPANAQYARLAMRSYGADAGAGDSWCWGTQFFMAEAQAGQQWFSAYSRGAPVDTRALGFNGDLDSTRGAPAGTLVGGALAELVASQAASVPVMSQAINQKLQKDGYDTITGQIGLQSKYALVVGDANHGVWVGSEGIVLVQNGVIKVTIPLSGDPTFAGKLIAAFGTFGAIRLAPGGFIASGEFFQFNWADAGPPGFYFGAEGLLMGRYEDGRGQFFELHSDGRLYMNGFRYENKRLTLTAPIIIDPTLNNPNFGTFTVDLGGNWSGGGSGKSISLGSRTATIVGGTDPKTIKWTVENANANDGTNSANIFISAGQGTPTVTLRSSTGQPPAFGYAILTCTVTSANGLVATDSIDVDSMHG